MRVNSINFQAQSKEPTSTTTTAPMAIPAINVMVASALSIALVLLMAVLGPQRAQAAAGETVVLVHGWTRTADDWDSYKAWLEAEGYTVVAPDLVSVNDNVANAQQIKGIIDGITGPVHLIGHSMGGLSARHYLKALGGSSRVSTYVSLDTPQYGVTWACFIQPLQMCPVSTFMLSLNAGDDTPGSIVYVQMVINYPALLDGGGYHATLSGLTHYSILTDSPTFANVLATLHGDLSGVEAN